MERKCEKILKKEKKYCTLKDVIPVPYQLESWNRIALSTTLCHLVRMKEKQNKKLAYFC